MNMLDQFASLPKIWADCCKDISVTRECLAMIHLYHNVCELCFIVQGFELLKDVTGMNCIDAVIVGTQRRSILHL